MIKRLLIKRLKNKNHIRILKRNHIDWSVTELEIPKNNEKPIITNPYKDKKFISILGFHNEIKNNEIKRLLNRLEIKFPDRSHC